jgi:hypothetical protein
MAKKVVASLQTAGKNYTKVIKMTRSPKTGAYTFKENVMHVEEVKNYLAKK